MKILFLFGEKSFLFTFDSVFARSIANAEHMSQIFRVIFLRFVVCVAISRGPRFGANKSENNVRKTLEIIVQFYDNLMKFQGRRGSGKSERMPW